MFVKILPKIINATINAGDEIISLQKKHLQVAIKTDNTEVTLADKRSNKIITSAIKEITPKTPIISEESLIEPFSVRKKWSEYWLLDPLDGTRSFIKGDPDISINIAYIKNNYPIFALIYDPFKKTHYCKLPNQQSVKIYQNKTYKINTSKPKILKNIVVGKNSSNNKNLQKYLRKQTDFQIFLKNSAIKFCDIAQGKYHLYPKFGNCYEWDTAAGVCILEGAGGSVKTFAGQILRYNLEENLISPNFIASV